MRREERGGDGEGREGEGKRGEGEDKERGVGRGGGEQWKERGKLAQSISSLLCTCQPDILLASCYHIR